MGSPFLLSGAGKVRWRVALPGRHVARLSVAADGMCFVATEGGVVALDGPETRWAADVVACWGCVLLEGGLLVTAGAGGCVVHEQRTGAVVGAIGVTPMSAPMPMAGGLLVFLTSGNVLRAMTVTGEERWAAEVPARASPLVWHDTVFVAEGMAVRAFDRAGGLMWRIGLAGEVDGSLVGLPGGRVLVPVCGDDHIGYLVLGPCGEVRQVPAHLPPGDLVVPLPGGLLVLPGWPVRDDLGEWHPTVTIVESGTGSVVQHCRVRADVHSIVADAKGLVAVAGSPTWEYWTKYHGWPGFDLRDDCYLLFLDKDGVRGVWTAGRPITGPLAMGVDGDLLVPVSGELVSLG
jgi:PQQ-like domain